MSYLRRFYEFLLTTFLKLDRVPIAVSPDERITRFIFSERHFNKAKGHVSYAAFMPSRRTRDISVYRTSNCREWKIWAIGDLFVARLRPDNVTLQARGDVSSRTIFQQRLSIAAKSSPHPRHAAVTDWPNEQPQQKIKAIVLAQNATLCLHPMFRLPLKFFVRRILILCLAIWGSANGPAARGVYGSDRVTRAKGSGAGPAENARRPQENPAPPIDLPRSMERKQKKELVKLKFESMKHAADELVTLSKSLQQEIQNSNQNVMSLKIVQDAEQIEKLARKIRNTAKGS